MYDSLLKWSIIWLWAVPSLKQMFKTTFLHSFALCHLSSWHTHSRGGHPQLRLQHCYPNLPTSKTPTQASLQSTTKHLHMLGKCQHFPGLFPDTLNSDCPMPHSSPYFHQFLPVSSVCEDLVLGKTIYRSDCSNLKLVFFSWLFSFSHIPRHMSSNLSNPLNLSSPSLLCTHTATSLHPHWYFMCHPLTGITKLWSPCL